MGKFKSNFVQAAKEEQKKEKEQKRLREKHHIEEDVVVVEKTNMTKFLIRNLARLIRITATIILFMLATLGLLSLAYPEVRVELIGVIWQILTDLKQMI